MKSSWLTFGYICINELGSCITGLLFSSCVRKLCLFCFETSLKLENVFVLCLQIIFHLVQLQKLSNGISKIIVFKILPYLLMCSFKLFCFFCKLFRFFCKLFLQESYLLSTLIIHSLHACNIECSAVIPLVCTPLWSCRLTKSPSCERFPSFLLSTSLFSSLLHYSLEHHLHKHTHMKICYTRYYITCIYCCGQHIGISCFPER